jgi:hypothetical protein
VQGRLTRAEAEDLVAAARRRVLELFPGKEETYELILAPRFARLMEEFATAMKNEGSHEPNVGRQPRRSSSPN